MDNLIGLRTLRTWFKDMVYWGNMQDAVITFLVAASPVIELRGSIPLAIGAYNLPVWQAFLFSVAGNMIPVFLLPFLGFISRELSQRSSLLQRYFTWLFSRSKKRHSKAIAAFRDFALIVFVAIPLPFTGAWTATVAAFVFGIPFSRAFPLILLGVIMAATIVTLLTTLW